MNYFGLAGDETIGTQGAAVPFYVGEAPVITDSALSDAAIDQYEVCLLDADGTIAPIADGEADPQKCVIAALSVASGKRCPYYMAGRFNHVALVWPADLDTLQERKNFFQGTMISIGHTV